METKDLVKKFVMEVKEGKAKQAHETLKQVVTSKTEEHRKKNSTELLTK
jgi:hypothetical protein